MGKNNPDTNGPQGYPPDPSASTQTAYDPLDFEKYALANCYTGNSTKIISKLNLNYFVKFFFVSFARSAPTNESLRAR